MCKLCCASGSRSKACRSPWPLWMMSAAVRAFGIIDVGSSFSLARAPSARRRRASDTRQNEPSYRTLGRRLGEALLGDVNVSGVLVEDR
jgi:hypothetical protein